MEQRKVVKAINKESFIWLAGILAFFILLSWKMGAKFMFSTMMNTAHDLILNTVFYIMGVAVLAGAISGLFSEFGIIALINKLLSPLMKPLYDLPGAASVGVVATYLSDNPAILSLAKDKGFVKYFKKYQIPCLTNLGTAFGMGLIVGTFMITQSGAAKQDLAPAALIGTIGAVIGSIVSVRIMMIFTKKEYGKEAPACIDDNSNYDVMKYREIRNGSKFQRFLESLLDGGKSGAQMGFEIIPGVVVICTLVLMLTNGPSVHGYTGAAYEGVGFLPWVGEKLQFIFRPLLGFQHGEALAFPITSLGAVGAALGLVPKLLSRGLISANDIAVFTAMGMCWSGYLSTHVAMMDALDCRQLTNKAILSHTIGGLMAGISAHFIYMAYTFICSIL